MNNFIEFVKGFRKGFKDFAFKVTDVINFILLFFVYYLGVGLTSIIAKVFRKHFLDLNFKDKNSYWVRHKQTSKKIDEFYRQF